MSILAGLHVVLSMSPETADHAVSAGGSPGKGGQATQSRQRRAGIYAGVSGLT